MKKLLLVFIIIFFTVFSTFATDSSPFSFYIYHDINVNPNISTNFYKTEAQNIPLDEVALSPSTGEQEIGLLLSTFNTDMKIKYVISWGDLISSEAVVLPFDITVIKEGNIIVDTTLEGTNGAGNFILDNVVLTSLITSTWTKKFICKMLLDFRSDPQKFRAGVYSTTITISQTYIEEENDE